MKAEMILKDKYKSYIYMERYVNNGSPSGYTFINNTSNETNPFGMCPHFKLLKLADADCSHFSINKNEMIFNDFNFIHPDCALSTMFNKYSMHPSDFNVIPTASSRTVFVLDDKEKSFLKLSYSSRLGRSSRQINLKGAKTSINNSDYITEKILNDELPNFFSILQEKSAKISIIDFEGSQYEWGTIYRSVNPFPLSSSKTYMVPAFSLFSKDLFHEDEFLINQFIINSGIKPKNYLEKIIYIILVSYWQLLLNCGLVPEMHSQNCLFEIDENFEIKRIVLRDMEDIDRDLNVIRKLGINVSGLLMGCYKEYDLNSGDYNYRTSYMYDFKLGEYLLNPIIETVCGRFNLLPNYFYDFSKKISSKFIKQLPQNYFTDKNIWFSRDVDDAGLSRTKKYVSNSKPKFR